jgi:hypothetical protein
VDLLLISGAVVVGLCIAFGHHVFHNLFHSADHKKD